MKNKNEMENKKFNMDNKNEMENKKDRKHPWFNKNLYIETKIQKEI